MKKPTKFFLVILLSIISIDLISQTLPKLTMDIDLTEPDASFAVSGGELILSLNYEVEATQIFSVNILNDVGLSPDYFLVINSSNSHKYSTKVEFTILRSLNDNESLNLKVELPTAGAGGETKIWKLKFTTKETFKPNTSFAYVSAIRSIDGEKADDEFFDAFFKFNLNLGEPGLTNAFSMAGFEFNFTATDTSSTIKSLEEAMFSVNRWLLRRSILRNNISSLTRAGFVGAGSKIFDQRIYLGGHLGIMEIKGGFFTTYLFAGYYYDPYSKRNPVKTVDSNGDQITRQFRNNFYTEFAVQAEGTEIPILSSIRLKIGILYPFKGKKENFTNKPIESDIRHRIVLEVPLNKVFKF